MRSWRCEIPCQPSCWYYLLMMLFHYVSASSTSDGTSWVRPVNWLRYSAHQMLLQIYSRAVFKRRAHLRSLLLTWGVLVTILAHHPAFPQESSQSEAASGCLQKIEESGKFILQLDVAVNLTRWSNFLFLKLVFQIIPCVLNVFLTRDYPSSFTQELVLFVIGSLNTLHLI